MAIQDGAFDLDEMFLTNLRNMPFAAFFNDDDTIAFVVIGVHLIVRILNEAFSMPQITGEAFSAAAILGELFTTFSMDETFMDAQ